MCGIAGLFFKRKPDRGVLETFARDVELLQGDRGPDDFGVTTVTDRLHFFHNRLAIIDPGRARQPMQDERGVITYNGEVYNYADLRSPDETYWLSSDTEVLLKGLNRQGVSFLQRTHAMFGFGYYNRRSGDLLLARDRLGVKQVYYVDTDEVFAFASTLKPLMQFSGGAIDGDAIGDYYLNRAIKAPRTLFRDIRELEPGCVLRFDTWRKRIAGIKRWWEPAQVERTVRDETEALDAVDRLLRHAVGTRLVSDVPVGAYLSGGVDSSLIVAIASETVPNLETFSVAMRDRRLDESGYAKAVAERYGLKHHVIDAEPASFLEDIESWALIQDDIVADPSALMLHKLSRFASEAGFKVMLSGEGADEAFGGYNAQLRHVLSMRYHSLFKPLKPAAGLIDRLLAARSKLRQFVHQLIQGPSYYGVAMIFEPVILEQLFRHDVDAPESVGGLSAAIRLDLRDRLPNDLLTRTDRATMSASIEARVPFLSHDLLNYSLSMDESLLINGHTQKYLLKRLAERYVPRPNIYRAKVGFDLPLADWLRGPLRPMVDDLMSKSWQEGVIDLGFVREIVDLHQAGTVDASDKIWAFMMLELNRRALEALPSQVAALAASRPSRAHRALEPALVPSA